MSASQWLGLVFQVSIMLTVLGLGLTAGFRDATFLFRRPALLLRAVISMNLVMPVVAVLIATSFATRVEVQVALAALAVSPVPPIIQKKQISAGGREEYVIGLLVAMSLLAIVLVPLTVLILDEIFHRAAVIGPAAIAKLMLMSVLAPLLAGLLIRHWFPAAEKASKAVVSIAGILLLMAAAVLLHGVWPVIRAYLGNGILLMLAVIALIGLAVGHLLGGPRAGDRTALAMSTASRHPAVALAIATSGVLKDPKPELGVILLYLLVATLVSIPYQKWRERAAHAAARAEQAGKI
jgi:bile acid:Na+ symporter, BASS family